MSGSVSASGENPRGDSADRLQRSVIVSASEVVPGVLPRHANSSVAGEGHAGESVGAAAGVGAGGSSATGWRAASSVRTSSRLNRAGISSHRNKPLYCRFVEGPFLRHGQLRIPKLRLNDNAVSSGKVGVSANHLFPLHHGKLCVLDRKTVWCCSQALVDRISEKHNRKSSLSPPGRCPCRIAQRPGRYLRRGTCREHLALPSHPNP